MQRRGMHHFSVLFPAALFALLMLGTTRGNDFDGTIARTRTRTRTRTRKGGGYVDDYDFDATVDDDARFGGGVQGWAAESSERNLYSLSSSTTRQKSRRKSTSSSSFSVLQNARKSDVRLHPYPHVVIENCLPDDVYEELEKFYPKHEDIVQIAKPGRTSIAANTRVDLRASMVLSSKKQIVSKAWEEFIRYHSSREFYEEVIDLFGEEVFTKYHGRLEEKYGLKLREMETEVRLMSRKKNPATVTLDAQIGVNTPVIKGQSRVRGLHVDNAHELYAGLLYFRDKNDPAKGGNLEVFECLLGAGACEEYSEAERWKHRKKIGWDVQFKNSGDFKLVAEVPYEKNQFVMFINSNSSYHAVSPRSASAYPRRLINIAANEYYKKEN
ncbi:unnamed protein product [Bathycoccus prasinos]